MCIESIVRVGDRVGVFSFARGYTFKQPETLIEWAKKDFDAYLFRNGQEETAEELFDMLEKTLCRNTRCH